MPEAADLRERDERLTIVLPTWNRPAFLARHLRLFAEEDLRSPVLVADSTEDVHRDAVDEAIETYGEALRLTHLRYDATQGPGEKIYDAAQRVETPWTIYAGDDDLLLPSGLRACLAALDQNPDWVGARGRIFELFFEGTFGWPEAVIEWCREAGPQERAVDRLGALLPDFWQTCQSVFRTEIFLGGFEALYSRGIQPLFAEVVQCAYPLTQGKVGVLDDLFYLHQNHPSNLAKERSFNDVLGWLSRPGWDAEYAALREVLIENVAASDGLPVDEVAAIIEPGILKTIRGWIDSDLRYRREGPQSRPVALLQPEVAPPPEDAVRRALRVAFPETMAQRRAKQVAAAQDQLRAAREREVFGDAIVDSDTFTRLRDFLAGPPDPDPAPHRADP